ncbi:protein arginine N-methyltransferase 9-like isoform X1 [Schistocerca piceifrons]|uniref:protein arginine N-methyltransferase 9-like isoform X1 n=1 Tax=Schistocerca piceifrons TaxID=274613 RepID=UPI001F5FE5E6|nr:protein arginine N-methyltransferase 9-like isoform X1 [Schistocerca piceifrons]XP_047120097.1 protein arginine N-methyltransferase 9-like isoform X1 [Schistocerca piceifrons]
MKPEAWREVACRSRQQAELYFQKQNFGRAFAHFLVALKLNPQWKPELKEQFSLCLCSWGNILESQNRYTDLFNCYEQALEVFGDNDAVLNNLGAHLYRSNHLKEALHYFKKAVDVNTDNLQALRNLQSVKNLLVERWHFRMLNDSSRNKAYRDAIIKKVSQGFNSVLDIGTGTGILSLFAVEGGAKEVFSCDVSETMINIAEKVISANNASGKIRLINKMSTDIRIPEDIPNRVSLVVTEIVDAGLVGEGILQTLSHASSSLMAPGAQVIPCGAFLRVVAISSHYIASCYRASMSSMEPVLIAEIDGPYDSDDITHVPRGTRVLTEVASALNIDFMNQEQLRKLIQCDSVFSCAAKCVAEGNIDAAAVWFELHLDDDIVLSSAPGSNSCWEQAIFPVKRPLHISPNQMINFEVKLSGRKLCVDISVTDEIEVIQSNKTQELEHNLSVQQEDPQKSTSKIHEMLNAVQLQHDGNIYVSQELVKSLNDSHWISAVRNVCKMTEVVCSQKVLDMSHFPMLGLSLLEEQKDNSSDTDSSLVCITRIPGDELAIRTWAKIHGINNSLIKCIREHEISDLESSGQTFDLIMTQPFETTGELREKTFNSLSTIRKLLNREGILLPKSISVDCKLVQSEWIKKVSGVRDISCTCGYDIADFINEYQVSQHLDFNLDTTEMQDLSETATVLEMTLIENLDGLITKDLTVPVVASGCVNAIPYWFRIQFLPGGPEFSTLHIGSFVKQAAVLVEPELCVVKNQKVHLTVKQFQSILHIELEEQ